MELNETSIKLLEISAKNLIKELNENKKAKHVREAACTHILDDDEEVQIHVLVTRDKGDFLEPFDLEVMN